MELAWAGGFGREVYTGSEADIGSEEGVYTGSEEGECAGSEGGYTGSEEGEYTGSEEGEYTGSEWVENAGSEGAEYTGSEGGGPGHCSEFVGRERSVPTRLRATRYCLYLGSPSKAHHC